MLTALREDKQHLILGLCQILCSKEASHFYICKCQNEQFSNLFLYQVAERTIYNYVILAHPRSVSQSISNQIEHVPNQLYLVWAPRYQGTDRNQQRNGGKPRFEDPTSNIRMARPPKRQGNIGDAMSDIRMAVPKRQGNHYRNFGEPELEGTYKNQYRNPSKLTNAKILACDLNKDGELDSKEYRSC